jgi:hypothetical protein
MATPAMKLRITTCISSSSRPKKRRKFSNGDPS